MIKKLLLAFAAFATGLTAYFTIVQGIPVTTLFTTLTSAVTSRLEPVTSYLADNKYTSLIGAGGITIIGILVKQFQNMKAKATAAVQEATAWKSETFQSNAVTDRLLQEKEDLETKVTTLQEQVANMPEQYTRQIADLTTQVEDFKKENERLQAEYNLAVRTLAEKSKLPETKTQHVG